MQMPPTDAKRDKSKSQRRKEGKGGRKATADRSPLKPLKPGNHPSSHIYTQAHAPASADARPHTKQSKHDQTYAEERVKRSN